ncbi:NifB/NifX family molybdenum-iron cluster-binding protein [Treponema primitia]|uniref:NifB/NifX family molybdenum-iron cluster-binding protein n=1 Tax=Treponema primitia TaxID=88058 RepID=UPI0002555030|nr:NifB/NifX family molybdenum-iron cluster-binding protein [Treponema primitia]
MGWRVAAASIDGILVTEHYGRSKWFYIVDVQPDGTFVSVERRSVTPLCESGSHSESGMAFGIQALRDCVAVLVAVIGPSARKQLELAGIAVFEQPVIIEDAAQKLAAYYGRINQPESNIENT